MEKGRRGEMTTNQRDLIAAVITFHEAMTRPWILETREFIELYQQVREEVGQVCEEMENDNIHN